MVRPHTSAIPSHAGQMPHMPDQTFATILLPHRKQVCLSSGNSLASLARSLTQGDLPVGRLWHDNGVSKLEMEAHRV